MHYSLPGSSVHGISQAKVLEWIAIFFSRGSSQPMDRTHVSCIHRWILYHWATREALSAFRKCLISHYPLSIVGEASQFIGDKVSNEGGNNSSEVWYFRTCDLYPTNKFPLFLWEIMHGKSTWLINSGLCFPWHTLYLTYTLPHQITEWFKSWGSYKCTCERETEKLRQGEKEISFLNHIAFL